MPATTPTLDDLVRRAAVDGRGATFIVDGERRTTFEEFDSLVDRFAAGLVARGIRPGDRVAIWMPNCMEWATAFFGVLRAGAVVVPVNTGLQLEEAEHILRHSGATVIVTATEFRRRALASQCVTLRARLDGRLQVIVVSSSAPPEGSTTFDELLAAAPSALLDRFPALDATDDAIILYTSGTTGGPKGVVHTHGFLPVLLAAGERLELTTDDCVVLYLPFFHIYGLLAGLVLFLANRATLVLMAGFDAPRSLQLIEAEGASILYGVPTTYVDQLAVLEAEPRGVGRVRLVLAPFGGTLGERVAACFGTTMNVFGMTETSAISLLPFLHDDDEARRQTVGLPVEGVEAMVVDEGGRAIEEPGVAGELLLRGASIFRCYLHDEAATKAAKDSDGWFHTNDLADLDSEGRFRFIGRRGDILRVGGELVDPAEVESVLERFPGIERAAVVGVEDERLGQVPHAWVQMRQGLALDVSEALQFAGTRLAGFKRPRAITVLEALPTTPSGKVQKFKLRVHDGDRAAGS